MHFLPFNTIRNAEGYSFYDSNGKTIHVESNHALLPVIVFDNQAIEDYERVFFCSRLQSLINVFNLNDFKASFDTLLIPSEILAYLEFRKKLCASKNDIFKFPTVVSETSKGIAVLQGGVTCEADLSELYYVHTYCDQTITKDKVSEFNRIVNDAVNHTPSIDARNRMAFLFNAVNVKIACEIVDHWYKAIRQSREPSYSNPYQMALEEEVIYFVPKPSNVGSEIFMHQVTAAIEKMINGSSFKAAYPIIIESEEDRTYVRICLVERSR